MTEHLIEDALKMALAQRDTAPGLLVHSDRGVQYRAQKYIDVLLDNKCRISMSRKGAYSGENEHPYRFESEHPKPTH